MTNQFFNIAAVEMNKANKEAADNIIELQSLTSTTDILSKWYFKNTMTKAAQAKEWDIDGLKEYITGRINKASANKVQEITKRLDTVWNANREIESISISVEWTKSKTWGNNPSAEIIVRFTDKTCDRYNSGKISGCGYDKESTAIARAINQCNEFLRAMYQIKEKNINAENRALFGYGSGYGVRPYLEGGVGVSCYPNIFSAIGYVWAGVSHGKTYDVYTVNKPNE